MENSLEKFVTESILKSHWEIGNSMKLNSNIIEFLEVLQNFSLNLSNSKKKLMWARMFYLQDRARIYMMWYRSCYWWLFLDFKPSWGPYMIQKRSYSLSTNVNWHFDEMVKIHLIMINNVNFFTIYESWL